MLRMELGDASAPDTLWLAAMIHHSGAVAESRFNLVSHHFDGFSRFAVKWPAEEGVHARPSRRW